MLSGSALTEDAGTVGGNISSAGYSGDSWNLVEEKFDDRALARGRSMYLVRAPGPQALAEASQIAGARRLKSRQTFLMVTGVRW
jgi:hypothetical protein